MSKEDQDRPAESRQSVNDDFRKSPRSRSCQIKKSANCRLPRLLLVHKPLYETRRRLVSMSEFVTALKTLVRRVGLYQTKYHRNELRRSRERLDR
jgi:hypothetical protein